MILPIGKLKICWLVTVDESGVVEVRSAMQVEMDVPDQSKIIIASFPIKVSLKSDEFIKAAIYIGILSISCLSW